MSLRGAPPLKGRNTGGGGASSMVSDLPGFGSSRRGGAAVDTGDLDALFAVRVAVADVQPSQCFVFFSVFPFYGHIFLHTFNGRGHGATVVRTEPLHAWGRGGSKQARARARKPLRSPIAIQKKGGDSHETIHPVAFFLSHRPCLLFFSLLLSIRHAICKTNKKSGKLINKTIKQL